MTKNYTKQSLVLTITMKRISVLYKVRARYSRDRLKHKIILLQQLGGLNSTTDTFHIMMSERGLSLGTVRREGGAWVSHRIEAEGPISLTSTTTSLNIDSQMETRTIIITPDESSEQTEAIQKQQAYLDVSLGE